MIQSRIRYKTTYREISLKKQPFSGAVYFVLILIALNLVLEIFRVAGSVSADADLLTGTDISIFTAFIAVSYLIPASLLIFSLTKYKTKARILPASLGGGLYALSSLIAMIAAFLSDEGTGVFLFMIVAISLIAVAFMIRCAVSAETSGKKLNRSRAGNALLFIFMGICGVAMAMPLVMVVNQALKPLDEIFQIPPRIFVRNPSFDNFADLFVSMSETWVPFTRYLFNTTVIMVFSVAGHVILASLAAYPLAKHKFPGKKLLFTIVILSLMFTWQVTLIPNYVIISFLGINNTYLALIIPAWGFGLGLFLMKQFMEQIPDSLIESARIDGAGEFRAFWKIIMPNVKPAWLTLAIFQFQQMWGNTGYLLIRSEELKPLQFAMQHIAAGGPRRAGEAAAVSFILAVIPITFFLICQSSILETMTTSGIKE
jgi:ABC-type glycerol-3-phosphate transport system permease component